MTSVLSPRHVSPAYAALLAEVQAGIDEGEARGRVRQLAEENPQVTAFSHLSSDLSKEEVRKLSDLGRWTGRTAHVHERGVLAQPGLRQRKLAIETGWDRDHQHFYRKPLEPWTCPYPDSAMELYGRIMLARDGAFSIGDFRGRQLDYVEYMRREELVSVGDDGRLHALSDMIREEGGRAYPGAPVADKHASIGRQLRDQAASLVLAALFNISRGGVIRWSRKRKQQVVEAPGGLRLTTAQVCAEANQVKASRRDLDDRRYLSVSTCRDVLRALIELGYITEAIGARAIRRMRSWFTLPRVIGRVTEDMSDDAGILDDVGRWRKKARA